MKIKIFLSLICFCLMSLQIAYSQIKTEEVSLTNGQLPLTINGLNFTAQLDKNSKSVQLRLTLNELRELKKNKCKITGFRGDTTSLKGKNKQIKLTFSVDTLHISPCIVYIDAPVTVVFFTDSVTTQKPSISVKLLESIAVMDINATRIKFTSVEPPFLRKSCFSTPSVQQSSVAVPSSSINQVIQSSHIKFILCSLDPSIQQKKSDLQQQLRAAKCSQVEEENQVPPPYKSADKVKNGFTIRFFSNSDAVLASDMKGFIETQYPNDQIVIEDMSSYYDLPKRLEIWIK